MKKGWKIFWLTCGITLVVGIALLGIGLGMGATMEIVKAVSYTHLTLPTT